VLVHGNGQNAHGHRRMIEKIRANPIFAERPMPIVFNEAHPDSSCLLACAEHGASWGYYDGGQSNYRDGFQSPPTNWTINTPFKRRFFGTLRKMTSGQSLPASQPPELTGFAGIEPGQKVGGTIFVYADVNDPTHVDHVDLLIDGELANTHNVWPYWLGKDLHKTPFGYDVDQLPPGKHELEARLVSTFGQESVEQITFEC
jgi:hypothetical protein